MMFTEKAKKTADACRFCWMCRHLCPVGLVTGKEINTARAKGLMVSLTERGTEFDETIAQSMWECALCGLCSADCATGYEPRVYVREARSWAVAKGIAPESVQKLIDRMLETGSMYGVQPEEKFKALGKALNDLPEKAETLLYIGEVAAVKTPEVALAVLSILKKAGISFAMLKDEPDSGAYLGDLIGFTEEARERAVKLTEAIDKTGAKTVVVLDPVDARIMKHEYCEWNCLMDAEVVTATAYMASLIEKGLLKPEPLQIGEAAMHDAGALARDLQETQTARNILAAMDVPLKEMFLNRKLSKSSGGALLAEYEPKIAMMTAKARWNDALRLGIRTIVTEAPGSFYALSRAVPEGAALHDIFTLLDSACKT
ncbi:MAG: (Fe-S)-binding protein [Negativicutes bacterium]